MLYHVLLGFFSMLMALGGVFMIRSPELLITRANPTLVFLKENLPERWTRRIVQGLGGLVVIFFVALFFRYLG